VKGACAGPDDLQLSVFAVSLGLETQRELPVCKANRAKNNRLTIAWFLAPDQGYLHDCAGRTGQHDAARISLVFAHSQTRLQDSMRLGAAELHERRVIAGVRVFRIRGYNFVTANRRPIARLGAAPTARSRELLRLFGGDLVVEFPVLEHLGPETLVDDVSTVLKKLPVDVLRDRGTGLRGVNRDIHWRVLRNRHDR